MNSFLGTVFLAGFSAAFAVLGLTLFLFRRRHKSFLWLAGFAGLFAILSVALRRSAPGHGPGDVTTFLVIVPLLLLAARGFVHSLLATFRPKVEVAFWSVGLLAALMAVIRPAWIAQSQLLNLFAIAALTDIVLAVVGAMRRGNREAYIVGIGILAVAATGVADIVSHTAAADLPPLFPFGVVALLLAMSTSLGRHLAAVESELESRIDEVQALSAQALEEERLRRREMERRMRLEAETAAQTAELEAASRVQAQMLPETLPTIDGFEIAAVSSPASEVGGDYYDLLTPEEGSYVICGDATGHGLSAGIMVTAAKSALLASSFSGSAASVLANVDRALGRLALARMSFALLVVKLLPGELEVASAGMPPLIVARGRTPAIDEVLIPAPPLGGPLEARYRAERVPFAPGDVALLATDGLPEAMSPDERAFGYDRLKERFAELAKEPADAIVDGLLQAAREWTGSDAAGDDVTFVAIRRAG